MFSYQHNVNICIDIFRNYFRDNAAAFIDAPEILSGEHNLEYYGLFQKYLKVYEVSVKCHYCIP